MRDLFKSLVDLEKGELNSVIRWFIQFRLIVVIGLLALWVTIYPLFYREMLPFWPLFWVCIVAIFLTLPLVLWQRTGKYLELLALGQLWLDTFITIAAVYHFGGSSSVFSIIIALPVISSTLLSFRAALSTAFVAAFIYAAMLMLEVYGILPSQAEIVSYHASIRFLAPTFIMIMLFTIALQLHYHAILVRRKSTRIRETEQEVDELRAQLEKKLEDINAELVQKNKKLVESEARSRLISDLTSDYAYALRVEADGKVSAERVIGAFERLTGYSAQEIKNRREWENLVHPDDRHIPAGHLKALLEGQAKVVEYRILRKDGKIRWMRDYAQPTRDNTEKHTIHIYGAVQDITEHREAEERYKSLIEDAPDGIIGLDNKGYITSCNSAYLKLTGYSKEELVGKHFTKVAPVQLSELTNYIKIFPAIISGKGQKMYEFKGKNKDGSFHYGEANISLIKKGGRIEGMQAFLRDITQRRQADEALKKHAQELEDMNRFMVGRELDMINLKKEVNALLKASGQPEKYQV